MTRVERRKRLRRLIRIFILRGWLISYSSIYIKKHSESTSSPAHSSKQAKAEERAWCESDERFEVRGHKINSSMICHPPQNPQQNSQLPNPSYARYLYTHTAQQASLPSPFFALTPPPLPNLHIVPVITVRAQQQRKVLV